MPIGVPPFGETALLLDLDGTLLDIAPTPDTVYVPPGLPECLRALRDALGGALAIVTGRPIDQVDALLPGTASAIAGEHGGAIRETDGTVRRAALPDPPVEWTLAAARIVERHPGAMLEQKQRGLVFHYRAVPDAGPALRDAAMAMIAPLSGTFQLLSALMAWEIRPRGVDKGVAVQALMAETPFAGRRPLFIGDDVTDEDGMAAARAMDGAGLRVDEWFGSAGGVRDWLAAAAAAPGRWPALPLDGGRRP